MSALLNLRSGASGALFEAENDGDTLIWVAAARKWTTGAAAGGVSSVFGRTGNVVAQTGDYDSDQVDNISSVPGPSVSDALEYLQANAGAVASVFGRTGVVVAATGDYDSDQVDNVSSVSGSSVSDALETLFNRIITKANWQGGLREVDDLAERNGIPSANRDVGMTVYQRDTDEMWRLIGGILNANWVNVTVTQATNAREGVVPAVGAVGYLLQSTGVAASWAAPLTYPDTFPLPTITQTATAGATGQLFTVQAQNAATTGGGLKHATGTGGTTPGEYQLFVGATKVGSFQQSNANDFLAFGANPAQTGRLRLPPGAMLSAREFAFGSDLAVLTSTTVTNNTLTFGEANWSRVNINAPNAGGIGLQTAGTDRVTIGNTSMSWLVASTVIGAATASSGFTLSVQNVGGATSALFRLRSSGSSSGNNNGTNVELEGGRLSGTGLSGGVKLKLNQDDTQANMWTMFEVKHLAASRRFVALCFPGTAGAGVTTTQLGANTGDLGVFVGDAATVATADAASGHIYQSDGGKPFWKFNSTGLRLNGLSASATAGGGAAPPGTVLTYLDVQVIITGTPTQGKMPVFAA